MFVSKFNTRICSFPQAGASVGDRPVEEGVRLPHLRTWFRTRSAIVLHLSNGILQVMALQCVQLACLFLLD